jgi:hypothetical protein
MTTRSIVPIGFALALVVFACGGGSGGGGADAGGDGDGGGFCPADKECGAACCTKTQACIDGACCNDVDQCSGVCCAGGSLCQAGVCRLDCGGPLACGAPGAQVCCGDGEICYNDECTVPGDDCDDIYDCGGMAYCEPTVDQCLPIPPDGITCLITPPPPGEFSPSVGWTWTTSAVSPGHNQVMMTPAVANLTDDNGDGVIDERDIPDVVFHTFSGSTYQSNGIMRAVSGDTGAELWSASATASRVVPGSSIAIGDIDLDGRPEIVTCGTPVGGLYPMLAFEDDGALKWATTDPQIVCGYSGPSIANLDQAGAPEILIRYAVVNADGSLLWRGRPADGLNSTANFTSFYDLTGNGYLDIVGGNVAYDKDGVELWSRTDYSDGFHAVADLDGNGSPDVVMVNASNHHVMAFRGADGTDLWSGPRDVNQGVPTPSGPTGGGPPTIADFDGDDKPEVAVAGGYGYVVFEGEDGASKWFQSTIDLSSRVTGSSVFDFEDDGLAEVLYADERQLHIYRGTDGAPLFTMCNSSGTLWEYPLVVDVDNDERAEIIVARNNYAFGTCLDGTAAQTGIAMIEDGLDNWVRTRRIWNQHTYHVTNVDESGAIPTVEAPNHEILGLNNFRQNVQPIAVPAAPDVIVESVGADVLSCPDTITVEALVKNVGDAGAPADIPVAFYEGVAPDYEYIGLGRTTNPLLPGQSQIVELDWTIPDGRETDPFVFTAAVDDDGSGGEPAMGAGVLDECEEDNNVSPAAETACAVIP